MVPALIFLAPPAGAGLWKVLQWVRRAGAPGWMAPVALAAAMISPPVLSLLSAETRYYHRVTTSLSPEVRPVLFGSFDGNVRFTLDDEARIKYSSLAIDMINTEFGSFIPRPARVLAWQDK